MRNQQNSVNNQHLRTFLRDDLLADGGKMAFVLPATSLIEIEKLALLNKLRISRLCRVKPNPTKPDFRILIELTTEECQYHEETLMIEYEQHHDYTPEYKELTKEFYLKF